MIIKALYSIREVADMLGMSLEKVRNMIDEGHLDTEKIGGWHYIPLATLQARPAVWESIMLRSAYVDEGKDRQP